MSVGAHLNRGSDFVIEKLTFSLKDKILLNFSCLSLCCTLFLRTLFPVIPQVVGVHLKGLLLSLDFLSRAYRIDAFKQLMFNVYVFDDGFDN